MFDMSQLQPRWLQSRTKIEWFWSLVPWVISSHYGKTKRKLPKITPTSYLTGVRGVACFVVFNFHIYMTWYTTPTILAYGTSPPGTNVELFQLPIFRLIWAGKAAVAIFFVLSGFVLSYSFLRKIDGKAHSTDELLATLTSSILRRPLRLFAPMMATVVITTPISYMGPHMILDREWFETYPEYDDEKLPSPSFFIHFWNHIYESIPAMNPFTWKMYYPPGLSQCWTLSMEYRGSLLVFLLCLVGWRVGRWSRKGILIFVAGVAQAYYRWDMFAFVAGMLVAELRVRPLMPEIERTFGPVLDEIPLWIQAIFRTLAIPLLLILSLVLCSWPDMRGLEVAPYNWFEFMLWGKYQDREYSDTVFYFNSMGAVGLLFCLENMPSVQALFTSSWLQYFGEVSFSFYLMHWWALQVVGRLINSYITMNLGLEQDQWFFVVYLGIFIVTIFTADLFWRVVDEGSVKLSKTMVSWMEGKKGESESQKPIGDEIGMSHLPLTQADADPTIVLRRGGIAETGVPLPDTHER